MTKSANFGACIQNKKLGVLPCLNHMTLSVRSRKEVKGLDGYWWVECVDSFYHV